MMEILDYIYLEKKWSANLIILLFIEIIAALLYWLNKEFLLISFVLIIFSYLFIYTLLNKPMLWIILIIFTSFLDNWGNIGGGITTFHIVWFLSFFIGFIYYLFNHNLEIHIVLPFAKFYVLYIFLALFSLIYSPNFESGISYISTTIALYLLCIWIITFLKNEKDFSITIFSLLICNSLLTLLIIYQILTFDPWHIVDVALSASGEKILRAAGTFTDPNVAAAHLVVGVLYGISFILYAKPKKIFQFLIALTVLISLVGIVLTFSRTIWISILFGLLTILFYQTRKNIIIILSTFSLFLIIFILLTPYGSFITERVYSMFDLMGDVSIRTRLGLIKSGIKMFIDHPIFGVGYRGFPFYYNFYVDPIAPQILLYVKESHTLIITLLAELGIAGVLIVLLWFRRVIVDIVVLIKKSKNSVYSALLIGSLANIVTFIVYSFFYGNIFPHFNFLWLIFGIIYSIYFQNQLRSLQ
jgi:putative inorganic carbon (hco3(-)) transporter